MSLKIKLNILFLICAFFATSAQSTKPDSFFVATWNVENFYDTINDTLINDEEFLPESAKNWNDEKYEQKIDNLVKVINYMNNGCGPDILALEEVENINVIKRLIYKMRDRDYIVIHRDSPDLRGIDAAMIYDRNVFMIDSVEAVPVALPGGNPTRDILYASLIHKKSKEKIHFFINHWPSRRGGEEKSNINRLTAASVLKNELDTLKQIEKNSNIIILGDFNDEPDNESIAKILGAGDFECNNISGNSLLNLSFKTFLGKQGSYLYGGNFDMIDQIIVSSSFLDGFQIEYQCNSFEVIKPQFMIFEKGRRAGGALPTFEGSNYIGGFSDHFPIGAKFILKGKNGSK
ncbi:MAG: endonuclease/exonuclease/phosphatase family protein [Melioribacteraceae bacterium]